MRMLVIIAALAALSCNAAHAQSGTFMSFEPNVAQENKIARMANQPALSIYVSCVKAGLRKNADPNLVTAKCEVAFDDLELPSYTRLHIERYALRQARRAGIR